MIYPPMTKQAMQIMYEAHKNQFDKSGLPYVFHPFHVAEGMEDEISCTVALLHDVVEDTDITIKELEKQFPTEVIEALQLLTHEDGIPYMEYIEKISHHPIAVKVKLSDLKHNSDITRLNYEITKEDEERLNKYKQAIAYLKRRQDGGQ